MSSPSFVSRAPRAEDAVLHRAMRSVAHPAFLEVVPAAGAPARLSALLGEGWRGTVVAAGDPGLTALLTGPASGPADVLHVLVLDADGAEADLLGSVLDRAQRPWVVAVRTDHAAATEEDDAVRALRAAGYAPGLFDGALQYLVAREHRDLLPLLDHPAHPEETGRTAPVGPGASDDGVAELQARVDALSAANEELLAELLVWRARSLRTWSNALVGVTPSGTDAEHLRAELEATRRTLSWRVTKPLRAVRKLAGSRGLGA